VRQVVREYLVPLFIHDQLHEVPLLQVLLCYCFYSLVVIQFREHVVAYLQVGQQLSLKSLRPVVECDLIMQLRFGLVQLEDEPHIPVLFEKVAPHVLFALEAVGPFLLAFITDFLE